MENLFEGIKVEILEDKNIVSYDVSNENMVVTGNHITWPQPLRGIYIDPTTGRRFKVISIFERKESGIDGISDGNPIVYAWKCEKNYIFRSEIDKKRIINQFKRITSELKESYDTIIQIPSTNKINQEISEELMQIVDHKRFIDDLILKTLKEQIWEDNIDLASIAKKFGNNQQNIQKFLKKLRSCFDRMPTQYFQYHFIPPTYRRFINQKFAFYHDDIIENSKYFNNKKVLIVDDTISTGRTISDFSKVIIESFSPKELVVFTAFSALNSQTVEYNRMKRKLKYTPQQ